MANTFILDGKDHDATRRDHIEEQNERLVLVVLVGVEEPMRHNRAGRLMQNRDVNSSVLRIVDDDIVVDRKKYF